MPARAQLKLRVLDSVGVAVGALDAAPIVLVREQLAEFGGTPLATASAVSSVRPSALAYSAAASTGARLSLGWQVSPGAR